MRIETLRRAGLLKTCINGLKRPVRKRLPLFLYRYIAPRRPGRRAAFLNMKRKMKWQHVLQIAAGLLLAAFAAVVFVWHLNLAVTESTMSTISELALHDKRSMEAYIKTCWDELDGIVSRFQSYQCSTILEVETHMNLERASGNFARLYLLAEDGRVFTDTFVTYDPAKDTMSRKVNLLPYFENGEE